MGALEGRRVQLQLKGTTLTPTEAPEISQEAASDTEPVSPRQGR